MSELYNPTDFFKARRLQILSMYNNADEILKAESKEDEKEEEELKKESKESDEELDFEDKEEKDKKPESKEKVEKSEVDHLTDLLDSPILNDIEKAVYADNHENRKLGRVGQQYGGKAEKPIQRKENKPKESTPKKIKINSPLVSHFDINGKEFDVVEVKTHSFSTGDKKYYVIKDDKGREREIRVDVVDTVKEDK